VCHGFDLTLTFGKYPEALQEMPQVVLFRHGKWTESSDEISAENEASKLTKKLKLSVPKDKENRWQFVRQRKQLLVKVTSIKWAMSNFVVSWTIEHLFKLVLSIAI